MQLYGLDEIDAKAISVSRIKADAEGEIRYIRNPAHDGPTVGQIYLDESVVVHCVGDVPYFSLVVHDPASFFIDQFLIPTPHQVLAVRILPAQCVAFAYMSQDPKKRFISFGKNLFIIVVIIRGLALHFAWTAPDIVCTA